MKNVLLTGATGFLGSHLLEELLRQGDRVTVLKRSTSDTWRIKHLLDDVATVDIDVRPLEEAFKTHKVDAVIHTACSYGRSGEPAHKVVETNLLFSLRLLDAATFFNTNTFFNTDTLLPKYLNAYSISKKQFTEWLRLRSTEIQVVNMKLEHMYGPKDDQTKFVPWLISQLQQGVERIPLTEGKQLRDFIYIKDVVAAYLLGLKKKTKFPKFTEFDVGTGVQTSVRDFVEQLQFGFREDNPNHKTTLGFGDIPLRQGELMSIEVDNSALVELGWTATHSLQQGIRKTIKAYK